MIGVLLRVPTQCARPPGNTPEVFAGSNNLGATAHCHAADNARRIHYEYQDQVRGHAADRALLSVTCLAVRSRSGVAAHHVWRMPSASSLTLLRVTLAECADPFLHELAYKDSRLLQFHGSMRGAS